ncbi:MAG: N-6 DNA methylase [Bacteroidales bacterium]|jgi:type I restriction enzyme M protein|nr:N-6 DNA methylase [Bacteroidales bacterium]
MDYQHILSLIGFLPKENSAGIFEKKYADGYVIEVDFEKQTINYGEKIQAESKTTQNFSQPENFVVLECVNRLLEKGYKPENIILEKTWKLGHQEKGRLDILVTKNDGSTYLMIECKTWGAEFDKEFNNLQKNGGQLFSYFQQDKNAEILMLYASALEVNVIKYRNEIIKIEDDYRLAGNVVDFYEKWNKLTKDNGIFDTWVKLYNFESKALTSKQLKPIKQEDSSLIFNQFLEILRHNVVSDKPNAFNKIFTLFLCKVYDEKSTKPNDKLKFQWLDGVDSASGENAYIDFLIRLSDLYKNGMLEFLEKEITDFSEDDFNKKYGTLDDTIKKDLLREFKKIRLEKNNEFAIKEVFDNQSFLENSKIVKEVVELLQGYRLRYNKRQQYLSDFFELLLTTGLKQESGQFFTPVPIAQFILKSLPIDILVNQKIDKGEHNNLLPYMIDYAAGSGHFITEGMHEIQEIINKKVAENYIDATAKKIKTWQDDHFDWATQYVYGIEKDYRLVKVGKVGCYLHGDGLANVILSDGLANFENTKEYKGLLKHTDANFPKENKQFDILVSNPPYSVSAFKNAARDYYTENDFELYNRLTDNSSEIECLFIERMKQLLKDGGVAGILLPTAVLNSTGIYTETRKLILQYFDIISIVELGVNTFMATKIKTVILFLRRKNNYDSINLKISVDKFFTALQDVTLNRIEKPVSKYVNSVWKNITLNDYFSLLQKTPNQVISVHEIYKEYRKKIKTKIEKEFLNAVIELEKEKLYYFILAYSQKTVMVKTGEKDAEKQFLGYEFSERGGKEGIHSFVEGKEIDECTQLFDVNTFKNPLKASSYIYNAFNGKLDLEIHSSLKTNIEYVPLSDLIDFKTKDFDLKIQKTQKVNINYSDIWKSEKTQLLSKIAIVEKGKSITKSKTTEGNIPVIAGGQAPAYFHNEANRDENIITISASGAYSGFVNYFDCPIFASDCNTVKSLNESEYPTKLIYYCLKTLQNTIYKLQRGQAQPHVYKDDIEKIKVPDFDKQEKQALAEIELLEEKAKTIVINDFEKEIEKILKKYLE